MSHAGNWSPEKRSREAQRLAENDQARSRERIAREVEAAKSPAPVGVVFSQHPGGDEFLSMHPCDTARRAFGVTATCGGCSAMQWVDLKPILQGPLAHAPWPRVMAALTCSTCGERPRQLAFCKLNTSTMRRVAYGSIIVQTASRKD